MALKHLVLLAIQVSILSTVFGFGLNATRQDLVYLLRQPGLLVRSLLAVFVLLPIVAVGLGLAFDFPQSVKIVLVALALSPVPPLLPRKETGAGGQNSYALGLMAVLSIVSIVAVPLGLKFLQLVAGREFAMKRRDGTLDALYAHWILGKDTEKRTPRWSVVRNVLHWGR